MKIFLVLFFIFLSGCSSNDPAKNRVEQLKDPEVIKIALAWPWSGHWSDFGKGAEMAMSDLNQKGGILGKKVSLSGYDDQSSLQQALIIAERIIDNPNFVAVIGTVNSYIALATASSYRLGKLPFITIGSRATQLTIANQPYTFRLTVNEQQLQSAVVHFLSHKQIHKVLLYYTDNDDGRDAANQFEKFAETMGIEIIERRAYEEFNDNYQEVLKSWNLLYKIDGLVIFGEMPQVAKIVEIARGVGISEPIIGTPSMFSQQLILLAGDAANGVIVPVIGKPNKQQKNYLDFITKYQTTYHASANFAAMMGYDSVMLLSKAIQKANSAEPDKLTKQLQQAKYSGLLQNYSFDASGDLQNPQISFWQVQNRQFREVE